MVDMSQALADFEQARAENRLRGTTKIDRLKHAVLAPLRELGIASVEVAFDGYGDSGAVEDISCCDAENQDIELPDEAVVLLEGDDTAPGETSLRSALEELTYAALELHHPGWENNDGAGGVLEIDVAQGSFMLDCKLRYTAYDDHYDEL